LSSKKICKIKIKDDLKFSLPSFERYFIDSDDYDDAIIQRISNTLRVRSPYFKNLILADKIKNEIM